MEENNMKKFLCKTKRLDTIKKKARELSILCNVDVCLVGTHQNPNDTSKPVSWQTWPEDKNEVARILNKYKKKVEEKEPKDLNKVPVHEKESSKKAIWEFDVDKALEGMSDEELRAVLDRVDEVAGEVDKKLDALSSEQNSGTHTSLMILDLPSNKTMGEANSDKFDYEGTHTTPLIVDLPFNQTMKEANREGHDSEGTHTTPMISGLPSNQTMEEANSDKFDYEGTHTTPMILDLPSHHTMEEANSDKFDSEGTHTTPLIVDLPFNQTTEAVNLEGLDSEGTHTTLMILDLPSNQTMGEANSDKFDSEGSHTTSQIVDLPFNLPMMETNHEWLDSEVSSKGLKLFGVFVIPTMEA